jgi:hypothetical protein
MITFYTILVPVLAGFFQRHNVRANILCVAWMLLFVIM